MRYFPLYEAKMFHQFDHRWATFAGADQVAVEDDEEELLDDEQGDGEGEGEGGGDKAKTRDVTLAEKQDPTFLPTPRYWVSEADVLMRAVPLDKKEKKELEAMDPERVVEILRPRAPKWLFLHRRIARTTDERSLISSITPFSAIGESAPFLFRSEDARRDLLITILMNSFVVDQIVRCKVGGANFNAFYLEQIAALVPGQISHDAAARLTQLALELVYTSEHLRPLAEACSYDGDPFPYDEDRRAELRAELDALVARLYGLNRKQLRYILCPQGLSWAELENVNDGWEDPTCSGPHALPAEPALDFPGETFRVLKEKEEKRYGEFRTRRLVLEAWDRLWQELGPVEPLPVRFGNELPLAPLGESGPGGEGEMTPEAGRLLDVPISTGLFAETPVVSAPPATRPAPPPSVATATETDDDFTLVAPEPAPPKPLKDKQGNIIRVRVLGASGQEIVSSGTVVGQKKQGDAVEWSVLVDETNSVRKFVSPPATLKRLVD